MTRSRARTLGLVVVVLVCVSALLTSTTQAGSLPAVSGTWTMTSDLGDWVGQGQSHSFSAPADGIESGSGVNRNGVGFTAYPSGILWHGLLGAPTGQQLLPGTTYTNATEL